MNRGERIVPLLMAVALAACDPSPAGTGPTAAPLPRPVPDVASRIGAGVAEAIAAGETVRVVIALDPSTLPAVAVGTDGSGGELDRASLTHGVRELVDGYLERVGPEEVRVVRRFMAVPALAVTVASQAALSRLAGDDAVVRVDLDVGGGGGLSLSVAQIGATERHARGNDGAGVNVAILDTGVDLAHPALEGRIVHEACFGGGGTPFCHNGTARHVGTGAARDDAGHGTHVVGIMAGSGEGSAPGVAPAAGIVAVKVMDNCSFAGCFYAFSELVAALDYLIANQETLNVRAINMSLGTSQRFPGVCDEATAFNMAGAHAVNRLRSLGVVTIASSMNNSSGSEMGSPACLSNVVAVGAVTREDAVPAFSNGNHVTDVLAPGVGITSLARGGGTLSANGTSMAAPHVAGCAALMAHAEPGVTADQMAQRLRTSPVRVTDPKNNLTYPRLYCVDPPPPDPVTTTRVGRPGGP